MTNPGYTRRRFLTHTGAFALGSTAFSLTGCGGSANTEAPAILTAESDRPKLPYGFQIGDIADGRAVVWARSDRPARMRVEFDTTDSFRNPRQVTGPTTSEASDFTSRIELSGLPAGEKIFLRVSYDNATDLKVGSELATGSFRTLPSPDGNRAVRFVWSGDTAGQGWGINPEFGGMKIYEAMRKRQPDFFVHSGDNIYADGPISAEAKAENGRIWKNIVTPEVSKVAETLNEFRGRYRYNLMDENIRRFAAEVPQIWQWDDHEVTNNWSASKDLSGDARYTEKSIQTLIARGRQAFLEYAPMRWGDQPESQRVYRRIPYGPLLDVFVVDMRSFRGPNSSNLQSSESAATAFLGAAQVQWLKDSLAESTATWKVIAADMPVGLQVGDGVDAGGTPRWEAIANGNNGAPLGRELEIAGLLRDIKSIKNVVWITADVHYCAAHYYDPAQAQFNDFSPFWEFVAGPLNAGSFGPNALDATFGPQVKFHKAPPAGQANLSPFAGFQFFGEVNIDPQTKAFTIDLKDLDGNSVYSNTLPPAA